MDKRKMTIKIYTKLHRKLKFEQNEFHKGVTQVPGRICSSFSTSGTCQVTIFTNLVTSHDCFSQMILLLLFNRCYKSLTK